MEKPRYTERQILCGIREVWGDAMGTDRPFDAQTRIDHFYESNRRSYHNYGYDDTE